MSDSLPCVAATTRHARWIVGLVALLSLSIPLAWPSPFDRASALPTTGPNVPVAVGPNHVDGSALAVDAAGTLHLVWKENATAYWGAFYSRSTDGGLTWRTPVEADPPYSGDVFTVSIAVEREAVPSRGRVYVAYGQRNPFMNETHVWLVSSTDGIAWSAPRRVDSAPVIARAMDPSVAASNGRVWVSWTDWRLPSEPHAYLRRSDDAGLTWRAEIDLSDAETPSLFTRVEAKGDTVAFVWSLPYPPAIASARTDDAGATWRKTLAARGDKSYESLNAPDLFLDDLGVEHLVYAHDGYTRVGANYVRWTRLSYSWSADGTTWSAPVRIDDGTNPDTWVASPSIAELAGTLWVAWSDNRTGAFHVYASWSTDGQRWGDGVQNGNDLRVDDLGVSGDGQWFASLRTGGTGVFVSWQDYRNDPAGDIYFSPLQTSPLVITEIQDEPATFSRVEVYNTAHVPYGLAGAILHAGATNVALDPLGSVPARGYVVIGASADADLQTPLALGTEGALVWIGRGTDILASSGSGSYGIAPDPLPGESAARFAGTLDYVGAWTRSTTPSFHARNAVPPPNLAPDLVLNEVLWNAFAPADRYAEVSYRGGGTLSLAGYRLVGDIVWTLAGGSVTNVSRHSVVSAIVAGALFDSLAVGADNLYLYDPAGRLFDMVGWTSAHTQGRSVARVSDGAGGSTAYDDASAVANGWAFDQFVQPAFLELGPAAEAFGDRGSTVEFSLIATSHAYAPDYVNLLPPQAPFPWSVRLLHTDRTPLTDSPGDPDALPDLGLVGTDASVPFLVDVALSLVGGPADGGTVTVSAAFANFPWSAAVDLRVSLHPYVVVNRTVAPSTVYVSGSGPPYNEIASVTVNAKASGTAVPILTYRDIVFLVDDNESMNFLDPTNLRTDAVKAYVELMRPQDRGALIGYHALPWVPNPYGAPLTNATTGGKGLLEDDADSLACSPYCYDNFPPPHFIYRRIDLAIEKANQLLLGYGDPRKLRTIVALMAGPCWPTCTNTTTAVATAARNGIAIYTIGMGQYLDEPLLQNMAEATGGRYYHVFRPQNLAGTYKGLATLRDDTAAKDPDLADGVPLIEDALTQYIVPLANSYVDPASGARRDPDAVVQLADRTLLRWNVPKLAVDTTWSVRYNVTSARTGTLDVAWYPDSRLAFVDWAARPVILPIPPATLTVLPTPTPPYVYATIPANNAVDVPLDTYIEATFSEAMDAPTVRWTVTPTIAVTPWWAAPNVLYLNHTALRECQSYTVAVTAGLDRQGEALTSGGAANPWTFSTVCTRPYVVRTSPAHNDANVALDASVVVTFSEPMDPAATAAIAPNVALAGAWDANGEVLTLTHVEPFLECTLYTVTASGTDPFGAALAAGPVPNPWSFETVCPPKVRYTITREPEVGVVLVNGVPWAVPAVLLLRPGDSVEIEAPQFDPQGPSRLAFLAWDDGGARGHSIIAGPTDATITARYGLQHPAYLALAGLAANPATITFTLFGTSDSAATADAWSSWVDDGFALAVNDVVAGEVGERWATLDTHEWTVTGPLNATVRYVHQYAADVTAGGLEGRTVSVDFEAWAVPRHGSAGPAWSDWVDADTPVSVADMLSVGPRERYRTRDATSWTADAPLAATVRYVHQFQPRVTLSGTDAEHTVGAVWHLDGAASQATGLSGEWLGWADAGTTIAFDERTSGDVSRTAVDPTSIRVDGALDATIRYTASPPPAPPRLDANWKPLVSLIYGLLLIGAGFAAGAKEKGRWRRLRIPFAVAAPELAIGLLSWGTGVLRIPDSGSWLSLGLWVDTALLGGGLVVLMARRRRRPHASRGP